MQPEQISSGTGLAPEVTGQVDLSTMPGMLRLQIFIAGAVVLSAAVGSPQLAVPHLLDEKIRHADELQEKGSLDEARTLYAAMAKELAPQPPSSQLGWVLNGLSTVSASLGDYRQSAEAAAQAEAVYRQLGITAGQSSALNNLGIAQGELGDYPAAQSSFLQALDVSRRSGDFPTQVRTLNNLGNAYFFPGKYRESLRAYEDAAQILHAHRAEKWTEYWDQITRFNQATLYQRIGRYQSALEIYKQVERSQGLSASDRAQLLTNMGTLYRRLGDAWKALSTYSSAMTLNTPEQNATGHISALKNIGIVYALDQGDLETAQTYFARALNFAQKSHNQREEMQAHLYLGETRLRQGRIAEGQQEFQLALTQARELGTVEEQWKSLYGIGRGAEITGDAGNAEGFYRQAIEVIETTRAQLQLSALRAEFLADKRDVYDALISILLRRKAVDEAFLFLERSRARSFQDKLSGSGERAQAAKPLTSEEVRQYLDPSTVLMEFWAAGSQVALLWCVQEGCSAEVTEIPAAEHDAILKFLRELPEDLGSNWRSTTAVLRPLVPAGWVLPPHVSHALVVPDGWLSSVPFDLVPLGNRGVLIEQAEISYLPTAAVLRRKARSQGRFFLPWQREMAAFGNPEVRPPQDGAEVLDRESALQPLPYSSAEILSIAQMLQGRGELALGPADVKSTFLSANARSASILHVSTHAFADADIPENSRILFSPTGGESADYLFLRELYDMDLRDVNLATLSACDTERGRLIRGEGVQAFSRALLFAGARSAVTTLWRVGDQPTSEFMKQFYFFALQKHQPKAQALRSAKLKFLHSQTELNNPAHWAGFVITGDGITPLPRFLSWTEVLLLAALVLTGLAAGCAACLRIRRRIDGVDRAERVVAQQP